MDALGLIAAIVPRLALALGTAAAPANAPPPVPPVSAIVAPLDNGIHFDDYLSEVLRANLDYASQKYNVVSAEAGLSIAALFPDPTLTAGLTHEVYGPTHRAYPNEPTIGLGWTLELGGKRGARMAIARDQLKQSQASLDDFLRTLKATATGAYVDALKARLVVARKQNTLKGLQDLVDYNTLRFKDGDIGEIDVAQARVARDQYVGEATSAEADVKVADATLVQIAGGHFDGREPQGKLNLEARTVDLAEALSAAEHRPDVVAADRGVDVAADQLRLAHANRWVDLDLALNYSHSRSVYSDVHPDGTPVLDKSGQPFPPDTARDDSLGATVTVPLAFSRLQHGEITQAEAALEQAKLAAQTARLQARTDVVTSYAQYSAAAKSLAAYEGSILRDTDQTLQRVDYAYRRGAVTIIDLIQAQQSANDLYLSYYDALAGYAKALASLLTAEGRSDFTL